MSELQAALEIQVELSKFYNVDLFQRGYYQVRTALRTAPKAPVKVEVGLPRNSECSLVFPASIMNGVAVSKTFQILYRNEDVSVNDVIVFKVYMLVDAQRIEASIEEADFNIELELWFSDEEFGPEGQNKLQCISQRTLRLHMSASKGLHHHIPVLFDYFHLSVICVTVHATLLALIQPYINLNRQQPKTAWAAKAEQSTMESVLFGPTGAGQNMGSLNSNPRVQQAVHMHRKLCHILLCAYESLQTSFDTLLHKLPPYHKPVLDHVDCHKKLEELCERVQKCASNEDELFPTIQSDFAQLCAQNVMLWTQYIQVVTLCQRVTFILAQEHHLLRVKRFAEGFFTYENPVQEALACFEPSVHGHADLTTVVRNSQYFQTLPPLALECLQMDGDATTLPIVYEDVYGELTPKKIFTTGSEAKKGENGTSESDGKLTKKRTRPERKGSHLSDASSQSDSSSSPKFKRSSGKLSFIKNMKPESVKRPSAVLNPEVAAQVATDPTACTLVGYRKTQCTSTFEPLLELGTLSPGPHFSLGSGTQSALFGAVSMPTTLAKGHISMVNSGSMPELSSEASKSETKEVFRPRSEIIPPESSPTLEEVKEKKPSEDSFKPSEKKVEEDKAEAEEDKAEAESEESEDMGDAIENGYLPSNGYSENSSDLEYQESSSSGRDQKVDAEQLVKDLSKALGETEEGEEKEVEDEESGGAKEGEQPDKEEAKVEEQKEDKSKEEGKKLDGETDGEKKKDGGNAKEEEKTVSETDVKVELDASAAQSSGQKTTADKTEKAATKSGELQASGLSGVSLIGQGMVSGGTDFPPTSTPMAPSKESSGKKQEGGPKPETKFEDIDDSYLSGQCTILELLQEEYSKSAKSDSGIGSSVSEIARGSEASDQSSTGEAAPSEASSKGLSSSSSQVNALKKPSASASHIRGSSSTPELSAMTKPRSASMLVSPVADKTISFIAAKETLRKQLSYQGHLYSDFVSQASTRPYFWPSESLPGADTSQEEGMHLIVCVHGLDGNSADLRLVKTYLELSLPGERFDFLMSERNQADTFADFEVMTDRLVGEINYHIEMYGFTPAKLSFVGHSLGNLIIRSALSRSEMTHLLPKLHTFLSLSGPHLGTLYNNSGLVNMGMWFMQKWKKSGSLLQLSLKDHSDPRQTFLYKLSQKTGLEFFRNILLVGSQQDRYVPYHSSRIELCKAALRDTSGLGAVYAEMVSNILQPIIFKSDITFIRYDVFHALPSNANTMIGRAAHIAVLDSELFIEKFVTVSALKYFK